MANISGTPGPIEPGEFKQIILKGLSNIAREAGGKTTEANQSGPQPQSQQAATTGKKAAAQSARQQSQMPGTRGKMSQILQKAADQVQFSTGMKSQLKQLRRDAIKMRHFRDNFEKKLLYFVKKEPSLADIKQAARFASSAIWDILKKARKEEDEDEIATYLLAMLMKIHSSYTFEHSERVMEWTIALAEELGIGDEQELENLGKAAFFRDVGMLGSAVSEEDDQTHHQLGSYLNQIHSSLRDCSSLHDIGKMRIPQAIINKTAPLTDEEYEIIKTHPLIGVEIVKMYPALHRAIPGIKHHHEKYDGSGYPDRLKGKKIPLQARIIAITDTFDAMTEDRPYRKALPYGDAINELLRLAGVQFDPDLVIPFLKVLVKNGEVNPENLDLEFDVKLLLQQTDGRKTSDEILDKLKSIFGKTDE